MEIAVLGLNHKTAPLEMREKLSVPAEKTAELLGVLESRRVFNERVIVSTCNRTEIYGACDDFDSAVRLAKFCLGEYAKLDPSSFEGNLYVLRQPDSVKHLFSVASGLDSMVIGETEITGQVKDAYLSAHKHKHTGKALNTLFQRSFKVAKNLRTHTEIGAGKVSVASVAVDLAEKIFNRLSGVHVTVIGTGEMATQVSRALVSKGAAASIVSKSDDERARELARTISAEALPLSRFAEAMEKTDIVIASTLADAMIRAEDVRVWMKRRHGRPLFMIDIAMPRNIESSVEKIDNVYLYNIDDLKSIADKNLAMRHSELEKCSDVIGRQTDYFMGWFLKEFGGLA